MVVTVRDGKKVWPMCPECGCRLEIFENGDLFHFISDDSYQGEYTDARGCKCSLIDHTWDNRGK
jgi:hypothetical protein